MKIKAKNIKRTTFPHGVEITMTTPYTKELDEWLNKNIGKQDFFDVEIGKKEKRSLDANAYFWVLCEKIAKKTHQIKTDIYRELVQRVGVFEDVAVTEESAESFKKMWQSKGLGWIAIEEPCKLDGCVKYRCYSGSSSYGKAEMARLIDEVIYEAKEMGIETMTPDQIAELKQKWKGGK